MVVNCEWYKRFELSFGLLVFRTFLQIAINSIISSINAPAQESTNKNHAFGGWRYRIFYQAIVRIIIVEHLVATQYIGYA